MKKITSLTAATAFATAACLAFTVVPAHADIEVVQGGTTNAAPYVRPNTPIRPEIPNEAKISESFSVFLVQEDCNVFRRRHKNDRTIAQAKASIWTAHVEGAFPGLKSWPAANRKAFDRAYAKHQQNYFARTKRCGMSFTNAPAPKPAPGGNNQTNLDTGNTPPAGLGRIGSGGSSFSS